jgi:hypothetical protein
MGSKPLHFSNTVSLFMKKVFHSLMLTAGAAVLAHGNPAEALTVTVNIGGTNYNVTTVSDKYDDIIANHGNPPTSVMPWYGNGPLTLQFVQAVGVQLGDQYVNFGSGSITVGPLFATSFSTPSVDVGAWDTDNTTELTGAVDSATEYTYAILEVAPPPTATPGPLPLLGAAAAFTASRRMRRRVSGQTFTF